jgi:ubiquinone/menaquinone biosynthesis C-methylase UbiE
MAENHYDARYWEFQREIGKIGGILNKFKFEAEIQPTDTVLDFGCGGGYLLSNLQCAKKVGVEINPHARAIAANALTETYGSIYDVSDNYVDRIISNHALEHVDNPMLILRELYRVLKPGGKITIVLPCEQYGERGFVYSPNDINNHLYTWCPMTFGNLCNAVGFRVVESKAFQHQWIPTFKEDYMKPDIHERCIEYAKRNGNRQIRLVGTKD